VNQEIASFALPVVAGLKLANDRPSPNKIANNDKLIASFSCCRRLCYIKKPLEKLYMLIKKLILPVFTGVRPTLFRYVDRLNLCHGPPFFQVNFYCDYVDGDKAAIEHKVCSPGHVVQNAPAGTRNFAPKMQ
jgi:hypothetical protein